MFKFDLGLNPCRNGGQCIKKSDDIAINNFYCNCPIGLTGYLCEFPISKKIRLSFIFHSLSSLSFEIIATVCKENICKNNGTCAEVQDQGLSCSCRPGFTGKYCEQKLGKVNRKCN